MTDPTQTPTTEDRMSTQPPTTSTTTADRLTQGEAYVLMFGGQATPWRATLSELAGTDRDLAARLVALDEAVSRRLAPVSTDLLVVTPRGSRLLDETAAPVAPEIGRAHV